MSNREKTLHNGKLKQLISLTTHIFQMKLKCYNMKFSCSYGVTHSLSLLDSSLFLFLSPLFPIFSTPPKILLYICLSLPFYRYIPCFYLYCCPVASRIFRNISSTFLVSPLLLSCNSDFWGGVCTVQVVSYAFNATKVR